jgi:hypothetical protein
MERIIKDVNCPKCGQVMEEGYVHSRKQILWSEDDKPRLFDLYDENLVSMVQLQKALWIQIYCW